MNETSRPVLLGSLVAVLLAVAAIAIPAPFPIGPPLALAVEGASAGKPAIPALEKAVSAESGSYAAQVSVKGGASLTYRLRASMPEDVAGRSSLVYRIVDSPPSGVTVDWTKVTARIEASNGRKKADVEARATRSKTGATVQLAELVSACPGLEFGDVLVVEYPAKVDEGAKAGTYRNVAHLEYLDGDTWKSTVDVDATVNVPQSQTAGTSSSGSSLAKTGDALPPIMPLVPIALFAAITAAIAGIAISRRRRDADRFVDR